MNPLDRAAGGDLTAKGVSFPQDLLSVRFTRSTKTGFLEAAYMFSPDAAGITSHIAPSVMDSDWTAANIQHYPDKLAFQAKMKTWGEMFWPRFKAAFAQGDSVVTP